MFWLADVFYCCLVGFRGEADVVFFFDLLQKSHRKFCCSRKVREAELDQMAGLGAGTRPELPGCVQPGREGGRWLVSKVGVIYSKIWV